MSDSRAKTIIVFSNDLDKVLAAFNIATGAASMGYKVSMFFTFWGICVLRKDAGSAAKKDLVDRLFSWMLPKGPDSLKLSQMHMGGMGTWMMKKVMQKKKVAMLSDLIQTAQEMGVRFIVCQMSMEMMGITMDELIEGLDPAGVASYLEVAEEANLNLFI